MYQVQHKHTNYPNGSSKSTEVRTLFGVKFYERVTHHNGYPQGDFPQGTVHVN